MDQDKKQPPAILNTDARMHIALMHIVHSAFEKRWDQELSRHSSRCFQTAKSDGLDSVGSYNPPQPLGNSGSECDISVLKLLGFKTFPFFLDKNESDSVLKKFGIKKVLDYVLEIFGIEKVSDSVLKKIINKILDLGSWCTFNYWAGWFMALIAQNGLFQGQKCFLFWKQHLTLFIPALRGT